MILPITLVTEPENAPLITVIEGPDGVGKSTQIRQIQEHVFTNHRDIALITLRYPDNHGEAEFRRLIMSSELAQHPYGQIFLFLADFVYTFEAKIKPHLDNPSVRFLFDRFIPSTCIYQRADIRYINHLLMDRYPDFTAVMKDAEYCYLNPSDFEKHKERLAKKQGDEINHLDPVGEQAILTQIRDYWFFAHDQRKQGLLGSYNVKTYNV